VVVSVVQRCANELPDMDIVSSVDAMATVAPHHHQACEAQLGEVLTRGRGRSHRKSRQGADVVFAFVKQPQ